MSGQESVRKGEAGRPAAFHKLEGGISAQAFLVLTSFYGMGKGMVLTKQAGKVASFRSQ